mgnify:CR=1 FL=1
MLSEKPFQLGVAGDVPPVVAQPFIDLEFEVEVQGGASQSLPEAEFVAHVPHRENELVEKYEEGEKDEDEVVWAALKQLMHGVYGFSTGFELLCFIVKYLSVAQHPVRESQ